MAGDTSMLVTAVDSENNLFRVEHAVSAELADKVMATNWITLPWQRQEGQESWARRRIVDTAIPWIDQWHRELGQQWPTIEQHLDRKLHPYSGTAWWLDEPEFTCSMHTDGEMPGSMHLTWRGPGTSFYWHKDPATLRYQTPEQPNAGYIMINQPDAAGYRRLLWHAMLTPSDSYRITSYTWMIPQ
jgi:hypothetical protein